MALFEALDAELALGGYAEDESFGYSADQLAGRAVRLVAASGADGELVGIGGLELQDAGTAELKRFYVPAAYRGTGVAAAVLDALCRYAAEHGVVRLRLETGDRQAAALAFYRRHGFVPVARFGPYVHSATSVCMQRELAPGG